MLRFEQSYIDGIYRAIELNPVIKRIRDSRILVTGATGMICSAVVDILAALNSKDNLNNEILLAGRNRERVAARFDAVFEKFGTEYTFVPYDATSADAMDIEADYIIHGASNAHPDAYVKQPVETMLSNIVGLKVLLDALHRAGGKRILYISSSEVYGKRNINDKMYVEDEYSYVDILNARACYPSAKRAAETMCVAYSKEYGVDAVIVRPGHIYGPTITDSDSRASAQFTRNAAAGEDIVMKSAGTQLRSYCHTLDCASAILTVLCAGENCNAYNISNPDSVVSIRRIAECLAECAGHKVVFDMPSDTEKSGYNLMDNSALDATKLCSLGWKAAFGIEEGCRNTIECFG